MTAQPIDTEAFLWLDRLDDAVKHRAYGCTCQVGGVDAMSIDTDWLRHALSEIRRTHRNTSERVGVAEHRATQAEARIQTVQQFIDEADLAGDWTVTCTRLQWAIDGDTTRPEGAEARIRAADIEKED